MKKEASASLVNLQNLRDSLNPKLSPWRNVSDEWTVIDTSISKLSNRDTYITSIKIRRWCRDNCKDKYSICNGNVAFKNSKDAFSFQLKFGQHKM